MPYNPAADAPDVIFIHPARVRPKVRTRLHRQIESDVTHCVSLGLHMKEFSGLMLHGKFGVLHHGMGARMFGDKSVWL